MVNKKASKKQETTMESAENVWVYHADIPISPEFAEAIKIMNGADHIPSWIGRRGTVKTALDRAIELYIREAARVKKERKEV